jgi:hypothetical protein
VEKEALALLCMWEDFIDWLQKLKDSEEVSEQLPENGTASENNAPDAEPNAGAFITTRNVLEPIQTTISNGNRSRDVNGDTPTRARSVPTMQKKKSSIFRFLRRNTKPVKTM